MTRRVRRVVVVGRDAAAWLAALALLRTFRRSGLEVCVVELPTMLSPVDCYATLPTQVGLHELLGIEEGALLSACAGTAVFAQRFANFSRAAPAFLHAYDTHGVGLRNVDFVQLWLRARAEGLAVSLEDFSLGAVAAKQGRFALRSERAEGVSRASYGYHLHAPAYAQVLKHLALKLGATVSAGRLGAVEREGDKIAAVRLAQSEQRIEGDLFIDASGAEAALIGQMPGARFESWSRWLPCDRIMTASGPRLTPLPAFSQISAVRAGWIGLFPLQNRTAIVGVYKFDRTSDQDMLESLSVVSGMKLAGEAVTASLRPGARAAPWIGNCVAIGQAAVRLEPLDAVDLHLAHVGVSHLITFFPADADNLAEAGPYNEVLLDHARSVRDFQIAHYKLNQRFDEPLWDAARSAPAPERLEAKLRLFGARGQVAMFDREAFQEQNWTSIFIGHGLNPAAYNPLADAAPAQDLMQHFQRLLRFLAEEVGEMPSLEAYLEMHAPPPGAGAY